MTLKRAQLGFSQLDYQYSWKTSCFPFQERLAGKIEFENRQCSCREIFTKFELVTEQDELFHEDVPVSRSVRCA